MHDWYPHYYYQKILLALLRFAEDETEILRVYPQETSGGAAMVARQTGNAARPGSSHT